MKKWVYLFNEIRAVEKATGGNWDDVKGLVGGKGAGLLDMTRAGVPVPPFFTVTTEACNEYQRAGKFPSGMWAQELTALKQIERATGKKFGERGEPTVGLLPLGCQVLDARHDGHRAEYRPDG